MVELRDESLRSSKEDRDIILSIVGAIIFYAIRPRFGAGRTRPIQSDEWKPLTISIVDDWVIRYLVNLCLITRGCLKAQLMPPSAADAPERSGACCGQRLDALCARRSRGRERGRAQVAVERGQLHPAFPFRFSNVIRNRDSKTDLTSSASRRRPERKDN